MALRRLTAALLCSVLVATAGCSGVIDSGGPPTPDTTTAGKPTTATTTTSTATATTTAPPQVAPGLTAGGVTDALALANAHRSELKDAGFVKRVTFVRRQNDTSTALRQTTVRAANESHWRVSVSGENTPVALGVTDGTFTQYADGERVLWRLEADGNVSYGVRAFTANGDRVPVPPEDVFRQELYARALVYTLFGNADVTVVSSNASAVRVRGTAEGLTVTGRQAANVEFTAVVTTDGLVRSLHLTYDLGDATVEYSVTFDADVTAPVDRPDWYGTAVNRTNETWE